MTNFRVYQANPVEFNIDMNKTHEKKSTYTYMGATINLVIKCDWVGEIELAASTCSNDSYTTHDSCVAVGTCNYPEDLTGTTPPGDCNTTCDDPNDDTCVPSNYVANTWTPNKDIETYRAKLADAFYDDNSTLVSVRKKTDGSLVKE